MYVSSAIYRYIYIYICILPICDNVFIWWKKFLCNAYIHKFAEIKIWWNFLLISCFCIFHKLHSNFKYYISNIWFFFFFWRIFLLIFLPYFSEEWNQIIKILFEKKMNSFLFRWFVYKCFMIYCYKFCKYNEIKNCFINIFFLIKNFEIENNTVKIFIFAMFRFRIRIRNNHILTSFLEEFFL